MILVGIYKIQSLKKPNRVYIGSAKNVPKRWKRHLNDLRLNNHHSQKLQRHYNKHGEQDLVFSILSCCNVNDLIDHEQFYIDSYAPYFNNRMIAHSNLGIKYSEESKCKIREYQSHRPPCSEETRRKMSLARTGIKKKGQKAWNKGIRMKSDHYEKSKKGMFKKGQIPWNKGLRLLNVS